QYNRPILSRRCSYGPPAHSAPTSNRRGRMRQTCIGATGSGVCLRLPHLYARVWVFALSSGLLCIAQPVIASTDSVLSARLSAHDTSSPPGPSALPATDVILDSASPSASATNLYSEAYWTAFTDL